MGQSCTIAAVTAGDEGGATLTLSGNVTILVADRLLEAAREAATHGDVTVDLSAVDHVDTAGLQVLLALRRTLAAQSNQLAFRGVPDGVRRFLRVSGLTAALGADSAAAEEEQA